MAIPNSAITGYVNLRAGFDHPAGLWSVFLATVNLTDQR